MLVGWLGVIPLTVTRAQIQLSPQAEISIITCGPDRNELYAAFGHSAIRVWDPAHGLDDAFNYGVFDFDQPNFYLNFARGYLYYKLGVYYYSDFEAYYKRNQRFIHEQRLQLTPSQKQKLFDFLMWNARPENQTYRYDYYHDNCASRIRDVLHQQLNGAVTWDSSYFKAEHSFRQKTDAYLKPLPWGDVGIDICLGMPIDRTMNAWEYMFLPDYVESFVDHATIKHDSVFVSLVSEKKIIFEPQPVETWTAFVHPWVAFGIVLVFILFFSWRDWRRQQLSRWLDLILLGITGLIGLLLAILWIATDHYDAAWNLNLVWAFPLHLIACILFFNKRATHLLRSYFLMCTILLVFTLIFWWALPQELNLYLIPIVAGLAIRCALNWKLLQVIQVSTQD
jgi:Domain of unknown function (DUF4105)